MLPATGNSRASGSRWLPGALLLLLYAVAVGIYVALGSRQALPQVAPDEYTYSALARSLADGHGLTWHGGSAGIRAALYIYAIAPAWLLTHSQTEAYAIAKAISAALACAVVFPTWWLARRYLPPLVALIPAALVVAGSWMTHSGQLIMENLALPLSAAALAALVVAVTKPGSRWSWFALGFAVLATWSRMQLAVLIPIIFVVLLIDVAQHGREWSVQLRRNLGTIAVTGAIVLVGAVIVLADPSVLGAYAGLQTQTDLGRGLPLAGKQALAFIAMAGLVPFILAAAISARRDAWSSLDVRALLIVFWVAATVFIVQTGLLTTAFDVTWSIQRYVEYTLPLLFVLIVVGIWRGLLSWRPVGLVTLAVAALFLLEPGIQNIQEQRGLFGIIRRADQLAGVPAGWALALATLIAGGLVVVVLLAFRSRNTRAALAVTVVAVTGLVFAVQDQAGWAWQQQQSQVWRAGFPHDLSWVDHAAGGRPVARLIRLYNPYRTPQTEFFNRSITRVYRPGAAVGGTPVLGRTCAWDATTTGMLRFDPACGRAPNLFLLNDDLAKITFYGQRVIKDESGNGRVVAVDAAQQRVKAVLTPPCLAPIATTDPQTGRVVPPRSLCYSATSGSLYLDRPGKVTLRFRGGAHDQRIRVTGSWITRRPTFAIPAHDVTDVAFRVPAGRSRYEADFDWSEASPTNPRLTSARLSQGRRSTELLY